MMGIFNVFVEKIADFKEYLTSMFENKVSPISRYENKETELDLLVAELFFFPSRDENKERNDLVKEMGKVAA